MIFAITYKNDIEAVFFDIFDAYQYIGHFHKEEQKNIEILRIYNMDNLKYELKENQKNNHTHCCGNCARSYEDKNNILQCEFTQQPAKITTHCEHYL